MIDLEKIESAIKKSSPEIKNLLFSTETGRKVKDILGVKNLEQEVILQIIDEIAYVILDFKSRFNFSESLTSIGVDKNTAKEISNDIEKNIFSELDKIKTTENKISEDTVIEKKVAQPNSYEQILINQAKAMRPVGVGEAGSMNYESRIMNKNVPDNLPTGEIHHHSLDNYGQNKDPYREPAE